MAEGGARRYPLSEVGRLVRLKGMSENPAAHAASFCNLTPHAIVIVGGPSLPPSGQLARCAQVSAPAGEHGGVALVVTQYGVVEGLPEPSPGVVYIVSALVRSAVPHRTEVASPGELVRNEAGAVVGCRNLVVNAGAL